MFSIFNDYYWQLAAESMKECLKLGTFDDIMTQHSDYF